MCMRFSSSDFIATLTGVPDNQLVVWSVAISLNCSFALNLLECRIVPLASCLFVFFAENDAQITTAGITRMEPSCAALTHLTLFRPV